MGITIAIDAMGGDFGPSVTVPAAVTVSEHHPDVKFILVGQREVLASKLAACLSGTGNANTNIDVCERLEIYHATEVVAMDESPAKALRLKKDSSMRVTINLVKDDVAQACVSAGNTGALMATAHYVLKTLPGIDRPAIIAALPTVNPDKEVRVLDLGANVDSTAMHLHQFAVMGSVLVNAVDGVASPKVGLLNVGAEEIKGNEQVKKAAQLLAENKELNYVGYVEGDDIFKGDVDVVVCDGFIGNVTLKALEGVVKLIAVYVKRNFMRNWLTKLAAVIARPALKNLARQLDPGRHNGASFIGLRNIVIKSHGGANQLAFANAIEEAVREVEHNVPAKIQQEVARFLQAQ